MADCEHLARTSAYFDGALGAGDEAAAAAHLATCAQCQALLGDAVGLDVALAGAKRRAPARSRRPLIAGALAAAAAVALLIAWPRHREPDPAPHPIATLELPARRAVEARFSGPRLGKHRPRATVRAQQQPTETIPLSALAELERTGDVHDLVGALAATGDLRRATEVAAKLPDDARSASDRAALALARGDAEAALGHAQHALALDPQLVSARWNLGLAARDLHLDRVARDAFAAVAQSNEPGWAAEAADQADARRRALLVEDGYPAFEQRSQAMIAGRGVLSAEDAEHYPASTRVAFFDAARLAPDRARLDELRPLAAQLDKASGTGTAEAALDRIDPALTSKYAAAYRAVIARTATPAEVKKLIAQLAAAGKGADDMRFGTIVLSGQVGERLSEVRALAVAWNDPWFLLLVRREELRARFPSGDPRGAPALRNALAQCKGDAWAQRCGQLATDLAELELALGHDSAAEAAARRATFLHRTAMVQTLLGRARAFLADLHRLQGRTAYARAEFAEVVAAAGTRDCDGVRFARVAEAEMAIVDGDWAAARAALPPVVAGEGCSGAVDLLGIAVAVDLARATHDPADRAAAERWLETGASLADGGVQAIGAVRLGAGDSYARAKSWIRAHASATDRDTAALRAWGVTTLIDDAGARGAWKDVFTEAGAPDAPCRVVASADDDRLTIAIQTPAGIAGEHRILAVRAQATAQLVSAALAQQLAVCSEIAVVARPPLHGRSDLLPPELPWWFAGDAPPRAVASGVAHRSVEVSGVQPPDPSLPAISIVASTEPFDVRLTGAAATPTRVLGALRDATYAELDVHGIASTKQQDAAYLALSPDPDGSYVLRADQVAQAKLVARPVIVIAACHAATVAPYLRERWSLPDAFVAGGASAVIAADVEIPDVEARPVFDEIHRRLANGEPPAVALATVRRNATAAWVRHLMLFR